MTDITTSVPINTEIVISERVVSTEFKVIEMQEDVIRRRVNVNIELGPFTDELQPDGTTYSRGVGRRGLVVWEHEEYDAVRATWNNLALIAKVTTILNN